MGVHAIFVLVLLVFGGAGVQVDQLGDDLQLMEVNLAIGG
jgi:hypothetical protein